MHIPIFGNGDVDSPEKAVAMKERYGVDGVMVGRHGRHPWFFREVKHFIQTGQHLPPPTLAEQVEAARRHLEMSLEWKGDHAGIVEMRRHYGNYFKGLPR